MAVNRENMPAFLASFGVAFPLFFTLSGGVYQGDTTLRGSGGDIWNLPLPVSILMCSMILFFFGKDVIRTSRFILAIIASMAMALLISLAIGLFDGGFVFRKAITIAQVMLPFIGLLAGMVTGNDRLSVAFAYLSVVSVVVPSQLFLGYHGSVAAGHWGLAPADNLHLFTIYAHVQYVNLILVCAFFYALALLWDSHKFWLSALLPLMLLYVLKSNSYLSFGAFAIGALAFMSQRAVAVTWTARKIVYCVALALCLVVVLVLDRRPANEEIRKGVTGGTWADAVAAVQQKMRPVIAGEIPPNVQQRLDDWALYGARIIENPRVLLFGRAEPMPREIRTNAHNYYLDITHTFGIIAMIPLIFLIAFTVLQCWTGRDRVSRETWWLAGIVFFLIVIDNSLKVTLRQPYPGIFSFYMWGMLLARLQAEAHGAVWCGGDVSRSRIADGCNVRNSEARC